MVIEKLDYLFQYKKDITHLKTYYSNHFFQRHDKRNLDELQKPAHIWIRHSLRKKFQSPSINLIVRRQASFRHPYTHITHSKKAESKKYKDDKKETALKKISKKDTGPHEVDEKPKRRNKADKTPSKSSHGSQLSKKSKSKSETNPESKDSISVSIKHQKKRKEIFKRFQGDGF